MNGGKRVKGGRERTVRMIGTSTGLLIWEKCIPPPVRGASPGEPHIDSPVCAGEMFY